jgi:hypothetical protein
MMADNTEKRVCVKFCFLLGSDQSLTEKNFKLPLFSVLSAIIKIAKPPSRHLEKKPQQH